MNTKDGFLPRARHSWIGALAAWALAASLNAADRPFPLLDPSAYELSEAIETNDTNTFFRLLSADPTLVHRGAYGQDYHLPLLTAAARGRLEMVDWLLTHGADIEAEGDGPQSTGYRQTALHVAVKYQQLAVCRHLLRAGADPNHLAAFDGTPLNLALGYSMRKIASCLLDHGANPFLSGNPPHRQRAPFESAIVYGHGMWVPRMLTEADLKVRTDFLAAHGGDLLRIAVLQGEKAAVEALLQAGVSPTAAEASKDGLPLLEALALKAAASNRTYKERMGNVSHLPSEIFDPVPLPLSPEDWIKLRTLLVQQGGKDDIFAATGMDDQEAVNRFLQENPDISNARDTDGNSPLHWAVRTDQPEMTSFWLARGASPAATNHTGQTPLHMAADLGLVGQARLLLDADSPIELRDAQDRTALEVAIAAKQQEIIRLLLLRSPAHAPDNRGVTTELHEAANQGDLPSLATTLESGAIIDARDELGRTPFQLAVLHGQLAAAAFLAEQGADVNARAPGGNTALHLIILQETRLTILNRPPATWLARLRRDSRKREFAAYLSADNPPATRNPLLETTAFLLAVGTEATATNQTGESVLQLAIKTSNPYVEHQRPKLLRLLVAHGADLNKRDARGETALHRAARQLLMDLTEALITAGADLNATNGLGRTPLHVAVESINAWPGPLVAILKAGPDVNARDNEGLTPLHLLAASKSSFLDTSIRTLLEAGADPNLRDDQGRTPLQFLLAAPTLALNRPAITALLRGGADVTARDHHGRNLLHCLAMRKYTSLFMLDELTNAVWKTNLDPNQRDEDGNTPMHLTTRNANREMLAWLQQLGGRLDLTNDAGETPLLLAYRSGAVARRLVPSSMNLFDLAVAGSVDAVRDLIRLEPRLLNQTNWFGQTALHLAIQRGNPNVAAWLASQGAEWDAPSAAAAGQTAILRDLLARHPEALQEKLAGSGLLPLAAKYGHQDTVELLLDTGAALDQVDAGGRSPLGVALSTGHQELAAMFRQLGARENLFDCVFLNHSTTAASLLFRRPELRDATNACGLRPTHLAAALGHAEVLRLLLQAGAPTSQPDTRSRSTPLHFAALCGRTNTAALLINHGAQVEVFNAAGRTPLHLAAAFAPPSMVRLLLAAGAHPDAPTRPAISGALPKSFRNLTGNTPLHFAARYCRTNTMQILLNAGANANATNSVGLTPLRLLRQGIRAWKDLGSDQRLALSLRMRLNRCNVPLPPVRGGDPFVWPESKMAIALLKAAGAAEEISRGAGAPTFRRLGGEQKTSEEAERKGEARGEAGGSSRSQSGAPSPPLAASAQAYPRMWGHEQPLTLYSKFWMLVEIFSHA